MHHRLVFIFSKAFIITFLLNILWHANELKYMTVTKACCTKLYNYSIIKTITKGMYGYMYGELLSKYVNFDIFAGCRGVWTRRRHPPVHE